MIWRTDALAGGAEGQANANLSRSPGHAVGNHGVDSDGREAEQERAETANMRAGMRRR